ncbi:putative RNA-dependent RNA polymerase [Magnaporthe oryzae virus 3]|uniref:RNA-directed RNA polymerase n=1 Tax=Magnaporthe oryzae virus 3 TaxID=1661396 RepID=A0A0G3BAH6_9VIRU|nr:putative RNA-dependent RNA polymerase [Magnaporthe oryzae virus 3]AKJ26314.1 putative RNA-dependent RNA polymerase [Magnaporthe oryzae virus 3]
MIESTVDDRANAAGAVGQYLKGLLMEEWARVVVRLPYERQISAIYAPTYGQHRVSELERAAAGFLLPEYPVQVYVSEASLRILLSATLPPLTRERGGQAIRWGKRVGQTVKYFPIKSHPGASNKVNLYLSEVLADLAALDRQSYEEACTALWAVRGRLYNDQATGAVLYGTGLLSAGVSDAYGVAVSLVSNVEYAKALSLFIKAVGANGSHLGSCLVEANTLQGRATGDIDLIEEARYRTTDVVHDKLVEFEDARLRTACRELFEAEIAHGPDGCRVEFPTLEAHWNSRWAWAVNGAHSGHVSRVVPRIPRPPGMLREHRRAWLECVETDPRPYWTGHTFVSGSKKLESGKTRAIFACDTLSYLAFEHLLGPVERRWRHSRVILDPGKGGHAGMAFRIAAAKARAGINMMLDYDDFNSQHSNKTMRILFEELISVTGYPPHLAGPLLNSFEHSDIYVGDRKIGRSLGTLMSGHRGTTFINTCLNFVYLRLVLGDEIMHSLPSVHVGDDVYLGARTYEQAGRICRLIKKSPLRMNPVKQSVGHVSSEFLRNSASGRSVRAYFARGVAGIVAGNWVTERALSPPDAITAMVSSARTLANRSLNQNLPLLLFSSVCRLARLPKEDHRKLRDLLVGTSALDNGPQFHHGGYYRSVPMVVGVSETDTHGYTPLPHAATAQYLSNAAEPLEIDILCQAGVSLVSAMEEASYRKSLPARFEKFETVRLGGTRLTAAIGTDSVTRLIKVRPPVGVLSKYPLLTLARKRLPVWLVKEAVARAGGNPNAVDLEYEAWGEFKHGCIIATPMSYSDAAMFGHRTRASVLTSPIMVYV